MKSEPWIPLDTETSGFTAPVFVVELAAQRMRGWTPDGDHSASYHPDRFAHEPDKLEASKQVLTFTLPYGFS